MLADDEEVDLVLLDVVMPGHGRLRGVPADPGDEPATEFLPVVMITASGEQQRVAALEAGADDFVTKPFDQSELLARVASLARIKRYHDTIRRQAARAGRLERRARGSGSRRRSAELERIGRLRRFLSPQLADLVDVRREASCRATAARSSWSSSTCATSRRSPRPASRRR